MILFYVLFKESHISFLFPLHFLLHFFQMAFLMLLDPLILLAFLPNRFIISPLYLRIALIIRLIALIHV